MTRHVLYIALAVGFAATSVALIVYAGGRDTYYAGQDVSRWEHVSDGGQAVVFLLALAAQLLAAAGLLAALAVRGIDRAAIAMAVVAGISLPIAWVAINTGH